MGKQRCCAILGHSPMRFAWGFDEEDEQCHALKLELMQQIMLLRQQGVTQFMVACDPGIGLYAGEAINVLRRNDSEMMLFCVTPYEEQATKWTPELRKRYFEMLIQCTHVSAVSLKKRQGAQLEAYQSIIDQSDILLAVYDPSSDRGDDVDHAVSYAARKGNPMVVLHPDTLVVQRIGMLIS